MIIFGAVQLLGAAGAWVGRQSLRSPNNINLKQRDLTRLSQSHGEREMHR